MSRFVLLSKCGNHHYHCTVTDVGTEIADSNAHGLLVLAAIPEGLAKAWGFDQVCKQGQTLAWNQWAAHAVDRWNAHQAGAAIEPIQVKPGPRKPPPQVCPEVWQQVKPDPERAMSAVREFCKGGGL